MAGALGLLAALALSGLPVVPGMAFGISRWDSVGGLLIWAALIPVFFTGIHFLARWTGAGGLVSLGIRLHRAWGRNLLLGLALGAAQVLLIFGVELLAGRYTVIGIKPLGEAVALAAVMIINLCYVAFSEELVFRGYLPRLLHGSLGPAGVAVGATLLFVLSHIPFKGAAPLYLAEVFLQGLFLVIPVLITRSLWFSIGAHWSGNTLYRLLVMNQGVLQKQLLPAARWVDFTALMTDAVMLALLVLVYRYLAIDQPAAMGASDAVIAGLTSE